MSVDILALPDASLGNSAFLVDLGDGGALLVDPARIVGPYVTAADERGLEIRYVAETHLHADFVSGSNELSPATIFAPAAGGYALPHLGFEDGDEITVGGLTLRALATPGHTPEHLAYLLLDGATPVALFSGGTLMAGGVARPDLISPEHTDGLARAAYRSIRDRLLALPDDLPVFPTHGGGSFCASTTSSETTTTIGAERRSNPLLQVDGEDSFVTRLLGGLGTFPPYFLRLREVNRRGPERVGRDLPTLLPRSPADVAAAVHRDAVVVDARPVERFAAGHVPGSVSIELRPQFATWLGWVLPFGTPLVVVLDADQDESELVRQALTVGYDRLVGRLHGGTTAWQDDGRPLATIPLVTAANAAARTLLDVRQESEWAATHAPGALHRELGSLTGDLGDLPSDLVTHCSHGQRAMTAASLLRRAGLDRVTATTAGPEELAARLAAVG